MNRSHVLGFSLLLIVGCSRNEREPASTTAELTHPANSPALRPEAERPTIDPKSSEAAEQLVRSFAGLLERGDTSAAYMLLGPGAPSREAFTSDLEQWRDLKVSTGSAGPQDGAAGSIYVEIPVTLSGERGGKHQSRSGKVVLRRVNDVPGSTEAERHWHIERVEWND